MPAKPPVAADRAAIDRAHIDHVPVVGQPHPSPRGRHIVVFDAETGQLIGHSPHVRTEQTTCRKYKGAITTTLKITPINRT